MLETSKDLLLLVLAFCILWLTIFICWMVYYLAMILRNVNKMTTSFREKMEIVDSILKLIKEKIEKSSSHLALISDGVIKLVGYLVEKKTVDVRKSRGRKKK